MVLLIGAAALTAVVAVPVWVRATGASALRGEVAVPVTGTQAAPAVVAAAVALLAAAAAVGLVGRVGRWVVCAVVAAAGAVVVLSAAVVVRDPDAAVQAAVAAATGVGVLAGAPALTVWPFLALGVGALDVVAAGVLTAGSRRWSAPTRRYAATGTPAATSGPAAGPVDDQAAWDALTRGDDPT